MTAGALAGLVVGAALVLAGAAKLASASWSDQAKGLGVPAAVALLVPWVELGVGALLVVGVGVPLTAWVAVGLLLAFTAVLVAHLARGRRPPCACFGALTPRPIGWGSVARNMVLVGLAVVAALA